MEKRILVDAIIKVLETQKVKQVKLKALTVAQLDINEQRTKSHSMSDLERERI
jgi:hypothetical protein